ncbi:hypothetical protein JKF63_05766 [Porcisia hertigi]|uniref:Uncharacterized protein n=1 Tax=Porcisia hertigi TaxID=2761500 RepID=A0A836LFY3_9TRYP|nr:hypothetical protein JKF63_05766 [Porcisia hertigi]
MPAAALTRNPAASSIEATVTEAAVSEADADVEVVVCLVNRFVISTVQFLNRFSDECESRLVHTAEALQQLELQTQLLEHLLLSSGAADPDVDEEEEECGTHSSDPESSVSCMEDGNGGAVYRDGRSKAPEAHDRRGRRGHVRGAIHRSGDAVSAPGLPAPPLINERNSGPRPPPGSYRKDFPPPPPGVARAAAKAKEAEAARAATLAIVGAPVPMPRLAADAPTPPPPLELRPGRLQMRNHPRLRGYFELLALRVPVALVKAKMQVDGFQGEWLDTPDLPAPSALSAAVRAFIDEPD